MANKKGKGDAKTKTAKLNFSVTVTPNGNPVPTKAAMLEALNAAFAIALSEKTDWVSEVIVKHAPAKKKAAPKAKQQAA